VIVNRAEFYIRCRSSSNKALVLKMSVVVRLILISQIFSPSVNCGDTVSTPCNRNKERKKMRGENSIKTIRKVAVKCPLLFHTAGIKFLNETISWCGSFADSANSPQIV